MRARRAGGGCLVALALLLLPAALFALWAACSLLCTFTFMGLIIQHGLQPHTVPRRAGRPTVVASFCRQMVSLPRAHSSSIVQPFLSPCANSPNWDPDPWY